ncbi:outer membrane adhesin like proteiin [Candidatus Vecturithrix granuli]|uniref:Outer membrane adhesin like proteiin n=1 Tax=Vecturithrix granuli TaxID=1499967 RepID=A0A081CA68_VECG1|nr:outer membrane adhesin like proteiin [Candidatus Vecturithrix granuli]
MRKKYFLFLLVIMGCLGIMTGSPTTAFAEGSVQMGLNQPLYETGPDLNAQGYNVSEIYVDILTVGEVINISLAGYDNSDQVSVKIYDPSEALRATQILSTGNGKVAIDAPFDGTLTTPYRFTTDAAGVWKVEVFNDTQNPANYYYNVLKRFDISVTASAVENPDPRIAAGRIYSERWAFYTNSFEESASSDADLYILVPGGYAGTNFVWQLDLNKFSGNYYELVANDLGVDSPYSGYSIASANGRVSKKYPIYLSYPAIADPPPASPAQLSNIRFIDDASTDNTISPGDTPGTQDTGYFEFTSNVAGTYAITIDTNQDGVYGGGDKLLLGNAAAGQNQIAWDGKNAAGTVVSVGTYRAQLVVRLGEYHFIANDAETSGGPATDGLTVCQAYPGGAIADDTLVFWDDQTYLTGTTTLPDGELCSTSAGHHTWGDFTSSGFGNERYIDTYVYGKTTTAEILAVIVTTDDTPINNPIVDLNGGATGTDFTANFTAEGGAINIAANGATITGGDSTTMNGAVITLTNPQTGDSLSFSGALPTEITLDGASTDHKLILTGADTIANYVAAIKLAQFNNALANPRLDTRTVTVTVTDEDGHASNPAISSITMSDSSVPEISVKQGTITIERGDTYSFGEVGSPSVTREFTIENSGNGVLNLSGSPIVKISGAHKNEFVVEAQPATSIGVGSSTTFTIRFAPGASGTRTAAVSITNDDSDENPYSFSLTGVGIAAPTVNAPTSANITTTTATLGGTVAHTGDANVTERGVYWSTTSGFTPPGQGAKVSVTGNWGTTGAFTINVGSLPSGATIYFKAFATNAAGTGYSDQASFTTLAPDINVKRDAENIPNGGGTALHCADSCTTSAPVTFTIENTGNATMNLTGTPVVKLSGDTAFFVSGTQNTATAVAPGGNTTFTLRFNNPGDGVPRLVTVTIENNDPDEHPYTFKVVGNPAYLLWTR